MSGAEPKSNQPFVPQVPFQPQGLLFDLDGTLLTKTGELRPEITAVFVKLRQQGIKIGFCTGRQLALMEWLLPPMEPQDKHVISGGAEVIDGEGRVEQGVYIESEVAKKVCTKMMALGTEVLFGQGRVFWTNNLEKRMANRSRVDRDLRELTLQKEDWTTPLIIVNDFQSGTEAAMQELAAEFDLDPKYMLHTQPGLEGQPYYDVTPNGVNKAAGARIWAEKWGIEVERVVAFGDNGNDHELIMEMGWGVVMEHGTADLKKIADEIVGGADLERGQGGLIDYLESLVKKGKKSRLSEKGFSKLPARALQQKKKKLVKLEQILRSKIWAELITRESGGEELKKQNRERVAEYKENWSEEKIWQDEASLSEYKVGLVVAYGREWGRARMEELLYFHLTNELTEKEKFLVFEGIL